MNDDRFQPSRRDRLRPLEFLLLSGVMSVFLGLITLMVTRDFMLSAIGFGITFIVVVLVLAMFALGSKQSDDERHDIDEQNRGEDT